MSDMLELSHTVSDSYFEGNEPAPPPFETVKWRIKIADREYGPYPRPRLIEFLKEGRIQAGTLLACGRDQDFRRADQHPQLRWDFSAPKKRRFGDPRANAGEADTPLSNFVVAARLVGGHERFEAALEQAGRATQASEGIWILRSRQTIQQIRSSLLPVAGPNERFVIVNASRDRLAWFNLGAETDNAVRSVWNCEDVD
jgi:hypothetical protein